MPQLVHRIAKTVHLLLKAVAARDVQCRKELVVVVAKDNMLFFELEPHCQQVWPGGQCVHPAFLRIGRDIYGQ